MSQGTHSGHSAATRQRIDAARYHYETRAERRPRQIWAEDPAHFGKYIPVKEAR